jgi:hypothetical protein
MPTVQNYIEQLQNFYKPDDVIAVHLWCTDDVLVQAKEMEVNLSEENAKEIIENIHRNIDSGLGVTWGTLVREIEDFLR